MDAAELAAQTLMEAFEAGGFRAGFLKRYQDRWVQAFGWGFAWSKKLAQFLGKYPIFLDAWAEVTRRRGAAFLADWAAVRTGARPKRSFFRPGMALPILAEAVRQRWRRLRAAKPDLVWP